MNIYHLAHILCFINILVYIYIYIVGLSFGWSFLFLYKGLQNGKKKFLLEFPFGVHNLTRIIKHTNEVLEQNFLF